MDDRAEVAGAHGAKGPQGAKHPLPQHKESTGLEGAVDGVVHEH